MQTLEIKNNNLSRKFIDMGAEHQLSFFLDKCFYNKLLSAHKIKSFERIHDKEKQLLGADLVMTTKKNTVVIDEKAQLYYINQNLPTFAFEINFLNKNGDLSEGWLYNDKLCTHYYNLIWLTATHKDLKNIKSSDFISAECLIINKNIILDYLLSLNYTKNKMFEKVQSIRNQKQYGRSYLSNQRDIYFYFSEPKDYAEQPINLIIRKNILSKLASCVFLVSEESILRKK